MAVVSGAVVAGTTGWLVVRSPVAALLVAAPLAIYAVLSLVRPPVLIAAFIIYFPLETVFLNAVPPPLVAPLRYAPELIGAAVAVVLLIRRGGELLGRLRPLWVPFLVIVVVSVASWLQSGLPLSTAVIGVRSELRYLPYAIIAAAVLDSTRDARIIGRAVCLSAAIQCGIGFAEAVGGVRVAAAFVPNYSVSLGGVDVLPASQLRAHTIFGSLVNYNSLATFLVFALAITFAIGARRLGLPVWQWRALLAADVAVIVLTGSREALVASVSSAWCFCACAGASGYQR